MMTRLLDKRTVQTTTSGTWIGLMLAMVVILASAACTNHQGNVKSFIEKDAVYQGLISSGKIKLGDITINHQNRIKTGKKSYRYEYTFTAKIENLTDYETIQYGLRYQHKKGETESLKGNCSSKGDGKIQYESVNTPERLIK